MSEFEHLTYLRTHANPVLNKLCLALLEDKPTEEEAVIDFMINWLQNEKASKGGSSD